MFRASATVARNLADGEAWGELSQAEYGVLYALTKRPEGIRSCELSADVLLTQTGISRLVSRLEAKGLVRRLPDPNDGRSALLVLTKEGCEAQRRIGRIHAHEITEELTSSLGEQELEVLAELCNRLLPDEVAAAKANKDSCPRKPTEP